MKDKAKRRQLQQERMSSQERRQLKQNHNFSGFFFHPQPPSLLILLSEPGTERKVLTKETWFSWLREWKSWKLQWEQFCPDQVLLSKNFHSRPGCRWKIRTKEFWGWGWGSRFDPQFRRQRYFRRLHWGECAYNWPKTRAARKTRKKPQTWLLPD